MNFPLTGEPQSRVGINREQPMENSLSIRARNAFVVCPKRTLAFAGLGIVDTKLPTPP